LPSPELLLSPPELEKKRGEEAEDGEE